MYSSIVVLLDTSTQAERALPTAESVARRCDAPIRLLSFVPTDWDEENQKTYLGRIAERLGVPATVDVRDEPGWTTDDLAAAVEEDPGALLCMTSFGRGHTGALLGSVAEGLLRRERGPALLVGPNCTRFEITDGDAMLVAVDASPAADEVLGLAGSWAISFGLVPWVVTATDPDDTPGTAPGSEPILESGAVHRFADRLHVDIGREVDWDVLHGRPVPALVAYADDVDASVIVMGTRGTSGLARLAVGSVCAATVHRAPCPVLTHRTIG